MEQLILKEKCNKEELIDYLIWSRDFLANVYDRQGKEAEKEECYNNTERLINEIRNDEVLDRMYSLEVFEIKENGVVESMRYKITFE